MLDIEFCFLKFAKVCFVVQRVENVSCELENNVFSSILLLSECILLLSIEYSINVNSIVLAIYHSEAWYRKPKIRLKIR